MLNWIKYLIRRWRARKTKEIFKFPITFLSCPDCGCDVTISRLIAQETHKDSIPIFTSLKQSITPLENPRTAVLTARTLIVHYDICAKCGREYPTKVEIQNVPIHMVGPKLAK